MKRIGGLFEHIAALENLFDASRKALRGKKHKSAAARFYFNLENELLALEKELLSGSYVPLPYKSFVIHEPKVRNICAADIRDRTVHHAICNYIEPILDRSMIYDTYACRKGKGSHAAVKRTQKFARRYAFFLKCDIRKYFESVDHTVLKRLLARKFKDRNLLDLLHLIIDHPVPGGRPGTGLPIGNLTSQVFANFYLGELDHHLKDRKGVKGYVRYMDDFLVFDDDKTRLHEIFADVRRFVGRNLLLEIREEISYIAPVMQGIPFLGFRIFPGTVRLKRKNRVRFRRKIRKLEKAYAEGCISRDSLADSVRAMVAHISHADTYRMRRKLFFNMD